MNSLERVVAALERRQPDRVPFFECVIDERVMQALRPGCDYFQFNDWIGLDNAGLNRSSWRRDNVEYVDEEKGLFRDNWGVIRAFGPREQLMPRLTRVPPKTNPSEGFAEFARFIAEPGMAKEAKEFYPAMFAFFESQGLL